jgi:hypothetical protein
MINRDTAEYDHLPTDWKRAAINAAHREARVCQKRDAANMRTLIVFFLFCVYVVLERFI